MTIQELRSWLKRNNQDTKWLDDFKIENEKTLSLLSFLHPMDSVEWRHESGVFNPAVYFSAGVALGLEHARQILTSNQKPYHEAVSENEKE